MTTNPMQQIRELAESFPKEMHVPKENAHIMCAKYPDLMEYHLGVSGEGDHAYTWKDKPHRLVYDLTHEISVLRDRIKSILDNPDWVCVPREDAELAAAFRDIDGRDYAGAYASLFRAHVWEKAQAMITAAGGKS